MIAMILFILLAIVSVIALCALLYGIGMVLGYVGLTVWEAVSASNG